MSATRNIKTFGNFLRHDSSFPLLPEQNYERSIRPIPARNETIFLENNLLQEEKLRNWEKLKFNSIFENNCRIHFSFLFYGDLGSNKIIKDRPDEYELWFRRKNSKVYIHLQKNRE